MRMNRPEERALLEKCARELHEELHLGRKVIIDGTGRHLEGCDCDGCQLADRERAAGITYLTPRP